MSARAYVPQSDNNACRTSGPQQTEVRQFRTSGFRNSVHVPKNCRGRNSSLGKGRAVFSGKGIEYLCEYHYDK